MSSKCSKYIREKGSKANKTYLKPLESHISLYYIYLNSGQSIEYYHFFFRVFIVCQTHLHIHKSYFPKCLHASPTKNARFPNVHPLRLHATRWNCLPNSKMPEPGGSEGTTLGLWIFQKLKSSPLKNGWDLTKTIQLPTGSGAMFCEKLRLPGKLLGKNVVWQYSMFKVEIPCKPGWA